MNKKIGTTTTIQYADGLFLMVDGLQELEDTGWRHGMVTFYT